MVTIPRRCPPLSLTALARDRTCLSATPSYWRPLPPNDTPPNHAESRLTNWSTMTVGESGGRKARWPSPPHDKDPLGQRPRMANGPPHHASYVARCPSKSERPAKRDAWLVYWLAVHLPRAWPPARAMPTGRDERTPRHLVVTHLKTALGTRARAPHGATTQAAPAGCSTSGARAAHRLAPPRHAPPRDRHLLPDWA